MFLTGALALTNMSCACSGDISLAAVFWFICSAVASCCLSLLHCSWNYVTADWGCVWPRAAFCASFSNILLSPGYQQNTLFSTWILWLGICFYLRWKEENLICQHLFFMCVFQQLTPVCFSQVFGRQGIVTVILQLRPGLCLAFGTLKRNSMLQHSSLQLVSFITVSSNCGWFQCVYLFFPSSS